QLAFLRAAVRNQDIPQDHAFLGALYRLAVKHRTPVVLTGSNYATESVLPAAWGHSAMDAIHIRDIFRRFGKGSLRKFPLIGFARYHYYYKRYVGMRVIEPLNFLPYSKAGAIRLLEEKLGWRYYGGKHYE